MNLKSKLGRLSPPVRPEAASAVATTALCAVSVPVEGRTDREEVLAALRDKMQALLGQSEPPRPLPPATGLSEAGMTLFESEHGPYWMKREVFRPSQRVGRAGMAESREKSSDVLSLLALDPALAGLDLSGALYLDTETTGLGGSAGVLPFLIGIGLFEDDRLVFEQLLLEGPEQEAAALRRVCQLVERATLLISFNGKSFDWPLLRSRFVMNHIPAPKELPHLDLLHVARRVHGRRIGKCSLKHVESAVLGFDRDGDIDGADVAARYGHYLRTGDASVLVSVIEHNTFDVASMAALVTLYGDVVPDLHAVDLASVSRTYRRAKAFGAAERMASEALERGGGVEALRARAEVNKALGERLLALSDYESADAEKDLPDVRLELAKLYEHFLKDPHKALAVVRRGTTEDDRQSSKRAARLERKIERKNRSL